MVSSKERFHCIQDSQLGPNGVHYREVPLYTGQPAGSQWCPLKRGSTVYRTASWVPMVSTIERFHCIQDSQLGPNGVHYREVPLYTGQPAGSQWCPLKRGSTVYRTASWVPMVSSIERFHCIHTCTCLSELSVLFMYTSMLFPPPVAEYAYSMAILAAVFLLFYLLALLVISRYTKELLVALFSGRLCGNNVDAEKDEEDGVEMTKETDCVEPLSIALGIENAELGEEETDGRPKRKPPTSNWAESIEMEELHHSFIPANGTTQSLPRSHGGSANSTPERYRKTQTISRDTRIRPPLRRQRTSYSESSSTGGGAKFKPSVFDILSGRYEDYRVRADSGSRRGTGSSTAGEGGRHGSTSSTGRRNPFERASTIGSYIRHDPGTAERLGRPPMRKTSSLQSPTDDEMPSTEREREGVQYASNSGLPSQEPRTTMSLPLYRRANTLASNPAPSPSEHPQTPSTVMPPGTPLGSIKEEDTLTRKPRPPLSRIASVDESESLIASQSSESSRGSGSGSGSGTPVLTGRHSPASPSRRTHLGLNLQKTVSKEKNELLTPLITTEPVSSGLGAVAAPASSTEPPASSIGTPNAVTVQTQPMPEVSGPMSHDVESPPSSASSPPAHGQLEERGERSSSAQPLTEQEESTVVELRSDDCKGDFLMDPTLAEMTFHEGKAAQQQSNR